MSKTFSKLLQRLLALFSIPILGFLLGSTEERTHHSEYHIHLGRHHQLLRRWFRAGDIP
jgi:hypothetical protein